MNARLCWRNLRAGLVAAPLAIGLIAGYSLIGIHPASATPTTTSPWTTLSTAVTGCNGSLTVTLTASITENSGPNLAVPSGCALTLNLAGYDLSITNVAAGDAAIAVPTGASVVVEDTSPTSNGILTATGGNGSNGGGGGAGIGGSGNGGSGVGSGAVKISSGTVTATGGRGGVVGAGVGAGGGGSGIGGGFGGNGGSGGVSGVVTISSGTVAAAGGSSSSGGGGGSGIGGGGGGFGGSGVGGGGGISGVVTISSGTVTAAGGNGVGSGGGGSGIGGGGGAGGFGITVTGGNGGSSGAVTISADGASGVVTNAGVLHLGSPLTVTGSGSLSNTGTISSISPNGTSGSLVNDGVVLTDSAAAISVSESGTAPVVFSPRLTGVYGGSQTLSSSGVVSSETLGFSADGAGVCDLSGSALSYTGVGNCVVDATLSDHSTTTAAAIAQLITVGGDAQSIVLSAVPSAPVAGGSYAVSATSTSGATVALSIALASSTVCSIASGTVTFNNVGTCTIDASVSGSGNYAGASSSQSIIVGAAPQSIVLSAVPSSPVAGGTYAVSATSTSGATVALSIASASSTVCSIASGTVTFNNIGTCTIDASVPANGNYAQASTSQSITVGAGGSVGGASLALLPNGAGYWVASPDGAVAAYGSALGEGSMAGKPLNKPIVGMASTPDGRGYWLVAADGGVFSFGDAGFYGSTGSHPSPGGVIGLFSTKAGSGYTLVSGNGTATTF